MRPLVVLALLLSSGCASLIASLAVGFERGKADVVVGETSEGVRYLERRPQEPAGVVVLLHGFGGNKDHWTRFIAQMPEELWIVAPDVPGFGESPKIQGESYDLSTQAVRLERFAAELGLARFHLVGNSMGGQLAAVYTLAHPERVESLVLLDPSGIPSPVPSAMDQMAGPRHVFQIREVADFDNLLALSFATPPDVPGFIKPYFVEQAILNGPFAAKILDDLEAHPRPMIEDAKKLPRPTLVVWGRNDGILDPSAAPLWRARVPEHLVVTMSKTGHTPMLERPAESVALVLAFWKRAGVLPHAPAVAP